MHIVDTENKGAPPLELVATQYDVTLGFRNLMPLFDSRGATVNDILGLSVVPAMHHLKKG